MSSLVADGCDALGFDPIFIETTGGAISERDALRAAHTVVLVLPPSTDLDDVEDELLALADVVVVNKADQNGAAELEAALVARLQPRVGPGSSWKAPVLTTTGFRGEGIEELDVAIGSHLNHLRQGDAFDTRRGR